jgi:hypothetical protein
MVETASTARKQRSADQLGPRLIEVVRKRPLIAVAVAGAAGALFGGVFLSRLGRLIFVAASGYFANEWWHREGRLDVHDVVERLSSR